MPRTLVAPPLFLAACLVLSACGGGKSETFRVASGAMLPTLLPGDVVLVAKGPFASAARRGEVVAFRDPEEPQRLYLKRAVALGGDRLRVEAGRLELNGVKVPARLVDAAFRYEDSDVESADRRQRQAELWREELDGWGYLVIHDRDAPPAEAVETVVPPEHAFVLDRWIGE